MSKSSPYTDVVSPLDGVMLSKPLPNKAELEQLYKMLMQDLAYGCIKTADMRGIYKDNSDFIQKGCI